MTMTFSSKPLGYYVDSAVEPFCELEEQFGSHLEQMPRKVKLVLRTCLTHFLSLIEVERGYDLQDTKRSCFRIIPPSAQELADWHSLLDPFWGENTDTLECFSLALCEQLRLDY